MICQMDFAVLELRLSESVDQGSNGQSTAVILRPILAAAIIAAAMLYLGACALGPATNPAGNPSPAATPTPSPAALNEPHMVTNLADLSSANTVAVLVPGQMPTPAASATAADNNPNAVVQGNIDRFFASNAAETRYHETAPSPPGETMLMNAKAQKYDEFAYALLKQTLAAAQALEPKKFEQRKLSSELKPVLLTAVMTPGGRLTDITIEQHSGDIAVDQLVIEACKRGLWARNPPPAALASDGNYRLRIRGIIYNESFDRYGKYTYDTR